MLDLRYFGQIVTGKMMPKEHHKLAIWLAYGVLFLPHLSWAGPLMSGIGAEHRSEDQPIWKLPLPRHARGN
jgi:hypothetical protein